MKLFYIQITTVSGHQVTITNEHLIYTVPCGQVGPRTAKFASNVQPGMCLLVNQDGQLQSSPIATVEPVSTVHWALTVAMSCFDNDVESTSPVAQDLICSRSSKWCGDVNFFRTRYQQSLWWCQKTGHTCLVAAFVGHQTRSIRISLHPKGRRPIISCENKWRHWTISGNSSIVLHSSRDFLHFSRGLNVGVVSSLIEQCADNVFSTEVRFQVGKFAPITEEGSIVVNGVGASCYVGYENEWVQKQIFGALFAVRDWIPSLKVSQHMDAPWFVLKMMETAQNSLFWTYSVELSQAK